MLNKRMLSGVVLFLLVVFTFVGSISVGLVPAFGYGGSVVVIGTPQRKYIFLVDETSAKAVGISGGEVPIIQTPYGGYFSYSQDIVDGAVVISVLIAPEGISYTVEKLRFSPPAYEMVASRGVKALKNAQRWLASLEMPGEDRNVILILVPLKLMDTAISGFHPVLMLDADEILHTLEGLFPGMRCDSAGYSIWNIDSLRVFPAVGDVPEHKGDRYYS